MARVHQMQRSGMLYMRIVADGDVPATGGTGRVSSLTPDPETSESHPSISPALTCTRFLPPTSPISMTCTAAPAGSCPAAAVSIALPARQKAYSAALSHGLPPVHSQVSGRTSHMMTHWSPACNSPESVASATVLQAAAPPAASPAAHCAAPGRQRVQLPLRAAPVDQSPRALGRWIAAMERGKKAVRRAAPTEWCMAASSLRPWSPAGDNAAPEGRRTATAAARAAAGGWPNTVTTQCTLLDLHVYGKHSRPAGTDHSNLSNWP
eukprot:COSAG05_NODE_4144_length_1653_cov_9.594749_1_plen_265_part_00